ncbi:MAG: tRNA pseudouridine(13) synthase TruD [Planctomycetes bacterium]|nr:tRNA pseudouridine(13) synthase TruD [Planctomycetota bacterium]
MKLKLLPEDFRVREVLDFVPDRGGPYFVHKLQKSKLDTLEAIAIVAEQARVDRAKIAFAGLKDRQGVTEQWISIEGQRVDFRGRGVRVRFVGRSAEPITSKLSRGNEFSIVLRDLDRREAEELAAQAERTARAGFANYFDDQRFGALRHGQGFVMKDVLRGRFEAALRGLVARPSEKAITGDVKLKRLLAKHWGDWERCGAIARGPVWQRLFQHLRLQPEDFRGALALLPTRQTLIHAYAYQSFLWNRAVDLLLKRELPPYARIIVSTLAGSYVSWRKLTTSVAGLLRDLRTPLFGPAGDGGDRAFRVATDQVLRDAGLTREDFEANAIQGMVLREEPRALVVQPRELRASEPEPDERERGRTRLTLEFGLPRGAYATMLIKHLAAQEQPVRPRGRRPVPPRRFEDRA